MSRDPSYEDQFLREAAKTAMSRYGIPADGIVGSVKHRLELGQRLYGNGFFMLDPSAQVEELLEEAWDACAYALMLAQARLQEGLEDEGVAWRLFEIATHAAAIDAHARALGREGG